MTDFLFSNYLGLDKHQVVKVKLKDQQDTLVGCIVSVGGVQSYQPAWTPDNAADLQVIKDLEVYKTGDNSADNFYSKRLYRNNVESIEFVNVNEL